MGFQLHVFICGWLFMKLGMASTKFRTVEYRLLIYCGKERVIRLIIVSWLVENACSKSDFCACVAVYIVG